MPGQFIFGNGKLDTLEGLVDTFNSPKVFLVTGKSSYEHSEKKTYIEDILKEKRICRHHDFNVNPELSDLIKGTQQIRQFDPGLIIAIGGGSVLDTAKLLSILPTEKNKAIEIIKGASPVPHRTIPFIAVPTTAGSGSEATHFAVAYIDKTKYSVASKDLLPDYSIIDPELTYTMPRELMAVTAFDAFCQAVESYWAVNTTPESRKYAAESITCITEIFDRLMEKPDAETREKMMKASHLAGKAINISKTTGPHAVSYTLTMNYGIPHGYAVILTLPDFFIHHAKAPEERINTGLSYRKHKERLSELCDLLNVNNHESAAKKIRQMVKSAGLKTKLSEIGVKRKNELEKIIGNVNMERLENNPVKMSEENLRSILYSAW